MISQQEILNASILIVDDQQSNIALLEEILSNAGYSCVTSTSDPLAVCALHQKNNYSLILLDLQMPVMDGFQVMEALKKIEPDGYLPVLVITAQPNHKLRALASGAKDFVAKPFDLIEVQTRIHNMLEVRLLYKNLEQLNKTLENYNQVLQQTVLERTAELRENEARLRRMTELSSDWHWEQDENGKFTEISGPVLEMIGIKIDEAQGELMEDQGALWNEHERRILNENIAARRPFLDFVYTRTNPDGSKKYLMVSGEPMFDALGRYVGYRGVGKDVSDAMKPLS